MNTTDDDAVHDDDDDDPEDDLDAVWVVVMIIAAIIAGAAVVFLILKRPWKNNGKAKTERDENNGGSVQDASNQRPKTSKPGLDLDRGTRPRREGDTLSKGSKKQT